jgi:hypothetical protein
MVGDGTMLKLSQDKTETKGNESKRLVVFYLRGINNDIHYFMILYSWFSSTGRYRYSKVHSKQQQQQQQQQQ